MFNDPIGTSRDFLCLENLMVDFFFDNVCAGHAVASIGFFGECNSFFMECPAASDAQLAGGFSLR